MDVSPSLIHRLFYPQVPLVLVASSEKRVSAMPVVSYASVSDAPPLVAVACNPKSFTCKLAIRARKYSLNLVDADRADAVGRLAEMSGRSAPDKLEAAGLRHSPGPALGVPTIDGAEAKLELSLKSKQKLGDHLLLVGRVRSASASSAFSDSWDFRQYTPILYAGWKNGMTVYDVPSTN